MVIVVIVEPVVEEWLAVVAVVAVSVTSAH